MQVTGLIGLKCLVLRSGVFRLQIAQIANPMPPQTPVEARTRDIRVQELPQSALGIKNALAGDERLAQTQT